MKVRGHRECSECGTQWSYYETGSVTCPSCGSLRSIGIDERTRHTTSPATLDLSPVRDAVDSVPTRELAERAAERAREYTAGYGFIDAGELCRLDDTYLAALELRHVAGELARRLAVADDEERYFLALLTADRGDRPEPTVVPASLRGMRGLAYAEGVRAYRSAVRTFLEDNPDPMVDSPLERLGDHVRRVRALGGDVPPADAETLVAVARAVGRYLREGDESALATAEHRLDEQL